MPPSESLLRGLNVEFGIATGRTRVNRRLNTRYMGLQARPRCRAEDQDRQAAVTKVLLVPQILVGRNEEIVASLLGGREQLPVAQCCPALLIHRVNQVTYELAP